MKYILLITALLLLSGCGSVKTVNCVTDRGLPVDGAEVVYEKQGWYIISGGTYTQYTGIDTNVQCQGCTSGVTIVEMVEIGTGIAGENLARERDCTILSPDKARRDSMIQNRIPDGD